MRTYVFSSEVLIHAPLDEVFDFFSKAENLQNLTPPQLHFKILTPLPIEMKPEALIEYRIKLMGVSFKWLTEITVWEPGKRFADVQRKGPYAKWEHEHTFEAEGEFTRVKDTVHYAVPGFFLAPLIHALFIGKQVKGIFDYRGKAIGERFPGKG